MYWNGFRACQALVVAFLLATFLPPVPAAEPALGVVTANGKFRLNSAPVSGNATLLEGALLETGRSTSRLQLNNGARIELSSNARARVEKDRLVLEKGFGDWSASSPYRIEARSLRITAVDTESAARVALQGARKVQVAALKGTFRVHTANGILVSHVEPGMALDFEPQGTTGAAPSSFLGCLMKKEGKWILFDQTTRIIVELRGSGFEREWGNRVQANGTTSVTAQPVAGAFQVLDVTSITRFDTGGCGSVAQALGAEVPAGPGPATAAGPVTMPTPPPVATGGGMSAGTKVAIASAVGGGAGGAGWVVLNRSRSK